MSIFGQVVTLRGNGRSHIHPVSPLANPEVARSTRQQWRYPSLERWRRLAKLLLCIHAGITMDLPLPIPPPAMPPAPRGRTGPIKGTLGLRRIWVLAPV